MAAPSFVPDSTSAGELPPWEVAKAYAFHVVLADVAEQLGTKASDLIGGRVDEYIAERVTLKGGGHPSGRCVRQVIARCQEASWYPGCGSSARAGAGRPPVYSNHQKAEVARVAMDLKRKLYAPTPRRVRARLPQASRNPETGAPMSKCTIHRIFSTLCYDEVEDDPWQYLPCVSQDVLPSETKPLRVAAGKWILANTSAVSWRSHVAIDPCYALLAKTEQLKEEQMIAAMGHSRWMSKGAACKGPNLRAPATTKAQGPGYHSTRVDWTPVFARGKLLIYVVNPDEAAANPALPQKLTDSSNLAKFFQNVLPGLLKSMQRKHKWADLPRTLVHDKASYFVPPAHNRLQINVASALEEAGFRSWVGKGSASAAWLVRKFGDVYPHETVISHIRRLLDGRFACGQLHESFSHFAQRLKKVEDYMNSRAFAAQGGTGLLGLAQELRPRCEEMVRLKGERLHK